MKNQGITISCLLAISTCTSYGKRNINLIRLRAAKNSPMRICEYRIDLFKKDYVTTEYLTYQLLKKYPLKKKVNYLAVPWARIINLRELEKTFDHFSGFKLKEGFTVCQHIKYKRVLPLLDKIGINILFTPHAKQNEMYNRVKVLPFPHHAINGTPPAQEKDILYSFIGYINHPIREQLLTMPILESCIIKGREFWHFSPDTLHPKNLTKEEQAEQKKEYQDILARSRFSLCPRGTGSSTLRFWESLQAGSIPVLISDEMTLPREVNWKTCIIIILEKDILKLNDILQGISKRIEKKMHAKCLKAYTLFSGKNLVRTIKRHYRS